MGEHVTTRLFLASIVLVALTTVTTPARAVTVVFDDFSDGNLPGSPGDPWTAALGPGTTSVTVDEAGGTLRVRDLNPADLVAGASYGISQSFAPIGDFQVDFDISWSSQGNGSNTVQALGVALLDSSGNVVVQVDYRDLTGAQSGFRYAEVGGFGSLQDAPGSLAFDGSASISIVRTGDQIDVLWDGALFYSGANADAVTSLEITFTRPSTGKNFGTEQVSLIQLAGEPAAAVPEPRLTAALAMVLGMLIASIRARRRS